MVPKAQETDEPRGILKFFNSKKEPQQMCKCASKTVNGRFSTS